MTQDHKVPTQNEVEAYIAQAKNMRAEVLELQLKRLFRLPTNIMNIFASRSASKKPIASTGS